MPDGDAANAPSTPPAVRISDKPRSLSSFPQGAVLGDVYRIRAPLSRGPAGRMFEADDLILNRRVAIKVPRSSAAGTSLLDEARVLAALRHPGLPEVHATGRHGEMRFLVMELLIGQSLEEHRSKAYEKGYAIASAEVLAIVIDICEALHALHTAGIAHRGIKPDSVMLCGDRGTVLVDCGLVASEASLSMSPNELFGASPFYVAPEALRGETSRGAGHLTDLYSLGVVVYELLTGSVPYNAQDIKTLTRLHSEAPIPDVRVLRPNLPEELARLVSELMAKKPGERPQAADEVLWKLRAIQTRLPRRDAAHRARAMVVSDDIGFASELRHRLDHWVSQVEVVTHHRSADAIAELAERATELVLFDCNIGDMDVASFLRKARSGKRGRPEAIVVLTDQLDEEGLDMLRMLGVRSIMPRGKSMGVMLEPVVRNVLAARDHRG